MNQISFLQAGSLNRRLVVEQRTGQADGIGGIDDTWEILFEVWANILPLTSRQKQSAGGLVDSQTHNVYLRHRSDIKSGMRFATNGRLFEILTVHDPDETSRYLHCLVSECA